MSSLLNVLITISGLSLPFMASEALAIRFSMTCWSALGSALPHFATGDKAVFISIPIFLNPPPPGTEIDPGNPAGSHSG
jgi:hypothetical protein